MKIYLEDVYDVDGRRFVACHECAVKDYQFTAESDDVNFSEYAVTTGLKNHTYNCPDDCEGECSCEIKCEDCGRILTGEANN
jgi:protein-arginine kinase activator protein McsA